MPSRLPKYNGNKKRRQPKKVPDFSIPPPPEYKRSKKEREEEAFKIMNTMLETGFTVEKYPCLSVLLDLVKQYVSNGERIVLDIPLEEINRRITGVLAIDRREQVIVCLKAETPHTSISSSTSTPTSTPSIKAVESEEEVAAAAAASSTTTTGSTVDE